MSARRKNPKNSRLKNPDGPECPLCGEKIVDMHTAIAFDDVDKNPPVHFDCMINRIRQDESLGEKEDVRYLGSGTFGIVETVEKDEDHPVGFVIRKKIKMEQLDYKQPWREAMKETLPQ